MNRIREFLKGRKAYLTMLAGLLAALIAWIDGEADLAQILGVISAGLGTLRAGIAKAEQSAAPRETVERLERAVREIQSRTPLVLLVCAILLAGSAMACNPTIQVGPAESPTRTVIVPPGEPVQLREPVAGAAVWVYGADGRKRESTADLPAGWWALPDPGER